MREACERLVIESIILRYSGTTSEIINEFWLNCRRSREGHEPSLYKYMSRNISLLFLLRVAQQEQPSFRTKYPNDKNLTSSLSQKVGRFVGSWKYNTIYILHSINRKCDDRFYDRKESRQRIFKTAYSWIVYWYCQSHYFGEQFNEC